MASISTCGLALPTRSSSSSSMSQPIHRRNNITILSPPKLSPSSLTFGLKGPLSGPMARGRFVTHASNSHPSPGDSGDQKSDKSKGPPFLTIVAGFLVLFIVFWILGSFVTWLFSLIVNFTSGK